jgi:hypothetical protein
MLPDPAIKPDDDELTEEEEHVNDEMLKHATRDDVHEQRERLQECEGVIHVRCVLRVA